MHDSYTHIAISIMIDMLIKLKYDDIKITCFIWDLNLKKIKQNNKFNKVKTTLGRFRN